VLPKVPHEELNKYYWNSDVVIDRFRLGSLGVVSLEAIACGRPVIAYVSSEYEEYKEFPLKDINEEEKIAETIMNADEQLWRKEYEYLIKYHDPRAIAKRVLKIYKSFLG
jgi:glycosyltransferase involved in cell wall biosynthesis